MTGVVNQTGARSGIVGTNVGTPAAAAAGKVVWAGWDSSHNQSQSAAPTLDGDCALVRSHPNAFN